MSYKTIEGEVAAEIVEKKSRFISHLMHVTTEEEALEYLERIRHENQQARHNVYAYILRSGRTRYSDDGEPAQTSGMPTYEVLKRSELQDVICVTTRYFGGVLLGTGGLVRAYTEAAKSAIDVANVVVISRCIDAKVQVPYSMYSQMEHLAKNDFVKVISTDFGERVSITFRVMEDRFEDLQQQVRELTRGECEMESSKAHECAF